LLCVYTCLSAQTDNSTEQLDKVYISDIRFKIPKSSSGKSVIKITKRELEFRQAQTIAQIINSKSGITINGDNSHQGVPVSTFVIGGQNRQVLVLIDGVAVNDPSQIENKFTFNRSN
jgi:vitamin B12 transporter